MKKVIYAGTVLTPINKSPFITEISDAAIAIDHGRISWVGTLSDWKKLANKNEFEIIDASDMLVTPGLIDCHTHLLFAGSRSNEFFERLSGKTYEQITKEGGGIHKTVRETRAADDEQLRLHAKRKLDSFLGYGVTTVEAKSGYGLCLEEEIRLMKILQAIRHEVDVIPTFLGAHLIPSEFQNSRKEYVRIVCEEMLPEVMKQKLSNVCDIFCDPHAFNLEETKIILEKAKSLGFQLKLHADQLSASGGAELAAEFCALSADHLDHVSEAGMKKMAKAGTVGVMVPTCSLFLGKKHQAPARSLIEQGVRLAISTDCNPGTSHTTNLLLSMSLAATEMKLSCEEIWAGVTVNAAKALGLKDIGSISTGMNADLCFWETKDPRDVPYHFGSISPIIVMKSGKRIPIKTSIYS